MSAYWEEIDTGKAAIDVSRNPESATVDLRFSLPDAEPVEAELTTTQTAELVAALLTARQLIVKEGLR